MAPLSSRAAESAGLRWPIVGFSKAFQHLDYQETAELVAEVGWQGIESPVRKGGQVLPEKVADDLPRLVEALAKRGAHVHIMATDIVNATDRFTEPVLRAAARLGIRYYRLGTMRYRPDRPIPQQLREIRAQLKDLAALNQELGVCAVWQNHSGSDNVGAPVWDIYEVIREFDPKQVGSCFDIGHATIEGGYAWRTHAQLMEPFFRCVYVKDFVWEKRGDQWRARWCPLGQGMISRRFFEQLRRSAFAGPISLHHEYPIGTGREMLAPLKQDTDLLRQWLSA